jgi:hypothetical protein
MSIPSKAVVYILVSKEEYKEPAMKVAAGIIAEIGTDIEKGFGDVGSTGEGLDGIISYIQRYGTPRHLILLLRGRAIVMPDFNRRYRDIEKAVMFIKSTIN